MNACTWIPGRISLSDLREVDDNSPEYLAECEARHFLGKSFADMPNVMDELGKRRGPEALATLKAMMDKVRPAYVLDLPNKPQRRVYLGRYELYAGANAAEHLRNQVLALNERRKAAEVSCADKAA